MGVLIPILITLAILGLLLWAIEAFPVLDATIKQIMKIIIIVVAALYVLQVLFGTHIGKINLN